MGDLHANNSNLFNQIELQTSNSGNEDGSVFRTQNMPYGKLITDSFAGSYYYCYKNDSHSHGYTVDTKIAINGERKYLQAKGYKPLYNYIGGIGPGTYSLNWNGNEVTINNSNGDWVLDLVTGSVPGSVVTVPYVNDDGYRKTKKVFILVLNGAGGGGGSSTPHLFANKVGSGGGGGGLMAIYVVLRGSSGSLSIVVGSGGSAAASSNGGTGSGSYIQVNGTNYCAYAGTGGSKDEGAAGTGGSYSHNKDVYTENSAIFIQVLKVAGGANGGTVNTTSMNTGSVTCYKPTAGGDELTISSGYSNGSSVGVGSASGCGGCGYAGAGGYSVGDARDGIGGSWSGGGSGGGKHASTNRSGGPGGGGIVYIYG